MSTITFEDFYRICRICMGYGKLQPLLQLKTIHVLNTILPIINVTDDNLPKNICQECSTGLNSIQEFMEKGQNSHTVLETLIHQKNLIEIKHYIDKDSRNEEIGTGHQLVQDESLKQDNLLEGPDKSVDDTFLEEPEELLENQDKSDYLEKVEITEDCDLKCYTSLKCMVCGELLFSKRSFASHMLAHRKDQIYQCSQCPKRFPYAAYLRRHTINSHGTKPFLCEVCQVGFARKRALDEHMNHHTGETPYICSHCGEGFKISRHFNKHIYLFHNPTISTVPKTNRKYTEKRVHLNIECKACGKTFASRSGFANHQLIHKGIKKFLCNICGKQFLANAQLQMHLRRHKGEKCFVCNECGKSFASREGLLLHLNKHKNANLEPAECSYCDKTFNNKTTLQSHIQKQHLSLLKCEFCSKKFSFASNLNTHLRVHNGEKPFMCSVCGKMFSQKQTLTVHMRMHTGITPFECTECDKKYNDSSNLKRHFRRHHVKIHTSE